MVSKKAKLKYVVKTDSNKNTKTVNARISVQLYDKFNVAMKLATENGMEITISKVMAVAMQDAINEVNEEVGQGALDL